MSVNNYLIEGEDYVSVQCTIKDTILKNDFNEVVSYDGYVPKMLDRRGDGYGDYLQFFIDERGYIQNWEVSLNECGCEW